MGTLAFFLALAGAVPTDPATQIDRLLARSFTTVKWSWRFQTAGATAMFDKF